MQDSPASPRIMLTSLIISRPSKMIELVKEGDGSAHLIKEHARIFAAADKLWQLASLLVQPGQPLTGDAHFHTRWVTLAYHARQLRAFRAVVLLLERGLVPEAQQILRPMIETHLHLHFIADSEDAAETARMYLVWDFANDQKLLAFVQEEEKAKHTELLKKLSDAFPEDKKKLGDKWKHFTKTGPSMLSTADLAKKLNFTPWYDMVYRRTSAAVHGFNILTYAKPYSDMKGFTVFLAPIEDGLDITLDAAIALLLQTSIRVDKNFAVGKNKDLLALDEEHAKWIKEKLGRAG